MKSSLDLFSCQQWQIVLFIIIPGCVPCIVSRVFTFLKITSMTT